jgi:hypothetical protein
MSGVDECDVAVGNLAADAFLVALVHDVSQLLGVLLIRDDGKSKSKAKTKKTKNFMLKKTTSYV